MRLRPTGYRSRSTKTQVVLGNKQRFRAKFKVPKGWKRFSLTRLDDLDNTAIATTIADMATIDRAFTKSVIQKVRIKHFVVECLGAAGVTGAVVAMPALDRNARVSESTSKQVAVNSKEVVPMASFILRNGKSPIMTGKEFIGCTTFGVAYKSRATHSVTMKTTLIGYFCPYTPVVLSAGEAKYWEAPKRIANAPPTPAEMQALIYQYLGQRQGG